MDRIRDDVLCCLRPQRGRAARVRPPDPGLGSVGQDECASWSSCHGQRRSSWKANRRGPSPRRRSSTASSRLGTARGYAVKPRPVSLPVGYPIPARAVEVQDRGGPRGGNPHGPNVVAGIGREGIHPTPITDDSPREEHVVAFGFGGESDAANRSRRGPRTRFLRPFETTWS
jgi:hypothetical protein